jgi:hypothetical protein
MEPSPCTPPPCRGLFQRHQEHPSKACWFVGSHNYKNKM